MRCGFVRIRTNSACITTSSAVEALVPSAYLVVGPLAQPPLQTTAFDHIGQSRGRAPPLWGGRSKRPSDRIERPINVASRSRRRSGVSFLLHPFPRPAPLIG